MNNFKNIVLGIAILILTMFVVIYGINTFYEKPQYDDYCASERYPVPDKNNGSEVCPAVCVEMYEIQNGECVLNECGSGCGPDGRTTFDKLSQCEIALSGKACHEVYNDAQEKYSRNVFLIALPLGILIIAAGAALFSLEAVGIGLMGGGIGTILYGVSDYWSYADNWLRFALSLAGLIILIVFAYWINKKGFKLFEGKKKKGKGKK